MSDSRALWERYCRYLCTDSNLGMTLDISRVRFPDDFLPKMLPEISQALTKMQDLEAGAIANPDENRMVGHYWLRSPDKAPNAEIAGQIRAALEQVQKFVKEIHIGSKHGPHGQFKHFLLIGIGGSALGPEFIAEALAKPRQPLQPHFIDNTDPDGIDTVLARLHNELPKTLVVVISKSGGTPETRNGMLEVRAAFARAGLSFARQAVAITQAGSALDKIAESESWLARFPMWDWVGGRTSLMSAVGLVPAALQGIDVVELLDGAAKMDTWTRVADPLKNPAALLALMWYFAGDGKGAKDMVILPYKDRLCLFSKYLQQLVMESLGKADDRNGRLVNQGIAVYGNKGSTDQHAYVQQLRDGLNNFFVTFIQVLFDRNGDQMEVDPGITSGDYLRGFWQGTRTALYENNRDSISLTIKEVTPSSVGALIALYERAVGLYAELVNINAYHQPGVEAGKKAAATVLAIQTKALDHLKTVPAGLTADQLATAIGQPGAAETIYQILDHMAHNPARGIRKVDAPAPPDVVFQVV